MNDLLQRFEPLRESHWPAMQALMEQTVERSSPAQSSLRTTCDYHLGTGGKRLRAMLPLLTAEAMGADPEPLVPFGAACEMLHNATLVHDDLQDGDTQRRGQDTVWRRFGAARAINLGDAMFFYAVLLVRKVDVNPARRDQALNLLLAETLRVIDGQERELVLRDSPTASVADYLDMVAGKTSGLFALPMRGAAILCGATTDTVAAIGEAARNLGVLFQIQDDLLDLFGDKGRDQWGSDIAEGKRSILTVHALASAPAERAQRLLEILDKPREQTSAEDRDEARELFVRHGAVDFARDQIAQLRLAAQKAVARVAPPEIGHLVDGLAELFLAPIKNLDIPAGQPQPDSRPGTDRDFCRVILPDVSRTFALSIAALPPNLGDAVLAAYLLCRIVDTIEDEAALAQEARDRLFDSFAEVLSDDLGDPSSFEAMVKETQLAAGSPDGELCQRAGATLRLFRSLPTMQRKVIRPRVLVMLEGMRAYCRRTHRHGNLRLRDLEELEQYCYYVAGAVGRLLTDLFLQATPSMDASARRLVADTAVSFGIGLQLVNIVKDVADDLERGVCFLPESLARHHGVELAEILEPQNRSRGLAVVRAVCARARYHLERAQQYTLSWPAQEGQPVRLFCVVPLALAIATLAVVEAGHDTLRRGKNPKISRETVSELLGAAHREVSDNGKLMALLERHGTPPPARVHAHH